MALSRRTALKAGLGTAALAAIPGVPYANWALKDRSRPDFTAAPAPKSALHWANWSGIADCNPERIFVPKAEEDLAGFMAETQGEIRPVGSGHSFSAVVPTEQNIVDISGFSGVIDTDPDAQTARIWAGTRLRQGARSFASQGLGMQNMPDVDVQSFAGAFATATHGTGASLAALHDHVIGLRMITPGGEVIEARQDSNSDLLQAAKVSLGAMGIITAYDLQLRENFSLKRQVIGRPGADILDSAEEMFAAHRNYEFYYLPNSPTSAEILHDPYDGAPFSTAPDDSTEILDALRALRTHLGWAPFLRDMVISNFFPKGVIEEAGGEYWRLLSTARSIKFNEMEYHIPAEDGMKALREITAVLDSDPNQYFPVEVRMTAQDDAWLSPFNDGPRLSIAVHAAVDEPYDHFFTALEPIFRKYGGRPHWGKLHSLTAQDFAALYPRFEDFRTLQREHDPKGQMLNPHLRGIFSELDAS
ncbi:MAG: FAD-binding protein [Mangrovicoccus sp.]|nr:FAD-binding protein [Mangrovicoccus sp.]